MVMFTLFLLHQIYSYPQVYVSMDMFFCSFFLIPFGINNFIVSMDMFFYCLYHTALGIGFSNLKLMIHKSIETFIISIASEKYSKLFQTEVPSNAGLYNRI